MSRRYLLIGDGRLATSFGPYIEQASGTVIRWSRRAAAAGTAPQLETAISASDVVLLAISDDAIGGFAAEHAASIGDRPWVHFSGARTYPGGAGYHPLFSFPRDRVDADIMERIVFVREGGAPPFPAMFPELDNHCEAIDPAAKPLYHALAVLSGNLAAFAWNEVARTLEDELQLDAGRLMGPYLASVLDGFAASPRQSLTGPLQRGDTGTVAANLAALADRPVLRTLYEGLVAAHGQRRDR
jgi:predicted short-subunit dehydrogenase-like oxidoreductase (DUF2520 family)